MDVSNNVSTGMSVDYISRADEMLEIFKKYNFSVDSFLKDESANLVLFSSLPDDFMEIQSVNERKKLFINTLLPIIYTENLKILEDRKKILDEKLGKIRRVISYPYGESNKIIEGLIQKLGYKIAFSQQGQIRYVTWFTNW